MQVQELKGKPEGAVARVRSVAPGKELGGLHSVPQPYFETVGQLLTQADSGFAGQP